MSSRKLIKQLHFGYAWYLLVPIIFINIISSFVPAISGYISKDITNNLADGITKGSFDHETVVDITVAIILLFAAKMAPSIINAINNRLNIIYQDNIEYNMTLNVMPFIDRISAIAYHSEEFLSRRHIYSSNGRITDVTGQLISLISQIVGVIAATAACISISPLLAILPFAVLIYTILSVKLTHDYFERMIALQKYWDISYYLNSSFSSAEDIGEMKIFGGNKILSKRLDEVAEEEGQLSAKLEKMYTGFVPMIPVIFIKTVQALSYIWNVYLIYIGKATVEDFVLFSSVSYIFSGYSAISSSSGN